MGTIARRRKREEANSLGDVGCRVQSTPWAAIAESVICRWPSLRRRRSTVGIIRGDVSQFNRVRGVDGRRHALGVGAVASEGTRDSPKSHEALDGRSPEAQDEDAASSSSTPSGFGRGDALPDPGPIVRGNRAATALVLPFAPAARARRQRAAASACLVSDRRGWSRRRRHSLDEGTRTVSAEGSPAVGGAHRRDVGGACGERRGQRRDPCATSVSLHRPNRVNSPTREEQA